MCVHYRLAAIYAARERYSSRNLRSDRHIHTTTMNATTPLAIKRCHGSAKNDVSQPIIVRSIASAAASHQPKKEATFRSRFSVLV